jgi:hypothetical protein
MQAEHDTKEMKVQQLGRERSERRRARAAEIPGEARQAQRRADKAAYLRAKLEERERSEHQAAR